DLDVAAQQAKLVRRQLPDILAFKMDVARGRLDQAKHAASGGRFAAAGFADQPQGLAAVDVKVHAVDRVDAVGVAAEQTALERKFLGQVRDPEQRLTHWTTVASAWMPATLWPGSRRRKAGCGIRASAGVKLARRAARYGTRGLQSRSVRRSGSRAAARSASARCRRWSAGGSCGWPPCRGAGSSGSDPACRGGADWRTDVRPQA